MVRLPRRLAPQHLHDGALEDRIHAGRELVQKTTGVSTRKTWPPGCDGAARPTDPSPSDRVAVELKREHFVGQAAASRSRMPWKRA
jgi:hypothetical protein